MWKGEAFLGDLREYRKKIPVSMDGLPGQLELPFSVAGTPFIGIRDLEDFRSGELRRILP